MSARRVATLGCLAIMVNAACRPATDRAGHNSVTVLFPADERLFGPYWSVEASFLMFLPLVTSDAHGEIVPRLARRWERSADFRTWTFHLRSDVRWHDGVPTTAYDVKFTLELQARPDILFEDAWHDLDSIVVCDDTTLTLYYRRPTDALNTWAVYWPKHLLERLDPKTFWDWEFWTHPMGNGPYRYVRHVPKTMVELTANPDFYPGKPAIERVIIKFAGSSAVTELLSGNVDILTWVNHADIRKLAADPRFRIYYVLGAEVPWLNTLLWNHRYATFADARVRRALTAAIDRRELLQLLNLPGDLQLTDVLYTARQYRRGEVPAPLPYAPDTARGLLATAGWRDADGDGVLERGGRPFRFTALVGTAEDEAVAVYVQAALRRVGIELQVERLEMSVLRRRVRSGAFEAAFFPFWNALDGHRQWLGAPIERGRESGEAGAIGYHNATVARLLTEAKQTADPDARDRIYRQPAPIIGADLPITFLFPRVQAYAVHRRVHGLASPFHGDPVSCMETLWLER